MRKPSVSTIAILLSVLLGVGLILYPNVSEMVSQKNSVIEADKYYKISDSYTAEYKEAEMQKAIDYNNSLLGNPVKDPFIPGSGAALPENYTSVLNIGGTMGVIEIPDINVQLPIYHGVSDEVLQKGVGHMEGTGLPIGSLGCNSLLTGHTGLPTARLFTDLIELELGDQFYIHILGEELIYEVDDIRVIEPEDVSSIITEADKDFVTLITCTPYGVNSHRLLVRGVRVHKISSLVSVGFSSPARDWVALIASGIIMLVLLVRLLRRAKKNAKNGGKKKLAALSGVALDAGRQLSP